MTYLYTSQTMKICSLLPGLRNPRRKKIIRKRVSSGPPKMRIPSHCLLANSRRQKCKVGAGSPYSQNHAIAATSEKSKSAKKSFQRDSRRPPKMRVLSHCLLAMSFIYVAKNAKSAPGLPILKILSSPTCPRISSLPKNHSKESRVRAAKNADRKSVV